MKQIRAILVDDEESARDVLQNLLARFCPEVTLIAKCENLEKAVQVIKAEKPDLVFSDIEMPNYAGYEIVNFFDKVDFEIVFVTAYDQYAIHAFEIAAIDYLLKPIDIERLKLAVNRVKQRFNPLEQSQRLSVLGNTLETKEIKKIVVHDRGQQNIISLDDIVAIEALESYCTIHTKDKKYTASKNLKHFETLLKKTPAFIRVHKSWIINKKYILNYSRSELSVSLTSGLVAKVSKYKKTEFEAALLT
jgi:two-component system, LytTR family, response regulator